MCPDICMSLEDEKKINGRIKCPSHCENNAKNIKNAKIRKEIEMKIEKNKEPKKISQEKKEKKKESKEDKFIGYHFYENFANPSSEKEKFIKSCISRGQSQTVCNKTFSDNSKKSGSKNSKSKSKTNKLANTIKKDMQAQKDLKNAAQKLQPAPTIKTLPSSASKEQVNKIINQLAVNTQKNTETLHRITKALAGSS